jgi:hypothetical protein
MQTTTSNPLPDARRSLSARRLAAPAAVVALCLGLSALAVVPFFFMGKSENGHSRWHPRLPDTHDMFLHLDQMKSFYNGLRAKELYPRWEIETNRGFGAPTTSFYPPGVYYLTSLFYYLSHNWLRTLFWSQLAMMIASAAAMYLYARRSMSREAALVTMGLYAIMPYHLIDQYHRGAIAELLGFVWMPLLLLFISKVFDSKQHTAVNRPSSAATLTFQDSDGLLDSDTDSGLANVPKKRPITSWGSLILSVAGIAISYGAFVWSHPPTAYQFSLALAIAIPLLAVAARNWRGVLSSGAGLALGIALAAAYIYPAAVEKGLITNEFIASSWPYHQSYVFVRSDYYNDNAGFFVLINQTWILNLAIIVICAAAAIFIGRRVTKASEPSRAKILIWAVIGSFAAFMMTTASYRLGARIPMIDIGVFSWRMLAITSVAGALLAGALAQYAIDAMRARQRSRALLLASLLTLVVMGVIVFNLSAVFGPIYNENLFQPEAEHFNYAMLPRTAPDDPEDFQKDMPRAEVDGEQGTVSVDVWKPQHREIRANLPDPDQLFVRTFNYPGWTATVDGNPAKINTGEDFGDIEIDLDEGSHTIVLDYLDTPVRKRGSLITIWAALLTVVLLIVGAVFRLIRPRNLEARVTRLGNEDEPKDDAE